jgi:pimeloyl-ACP methyl ester carboxylesterase
MSNNELRSVISADGTRIGFERSGAGPALLLVHGGTSDRHRWAHITPGLAERYTVYLMDRRGRGLSQDCGAGYALAREAEDIAAVVDSIGDQVFVLGHSFGATCSLEAGLISDGIAAMLLYEPPFTTSIYSPVSQKVLLRLEELLAAGLREQALEAFYLEANGAAEGQSLIDTLKGTPVWNARMAVVHTIVREAGEADAYGSDLTRLSRLKMPVRFLIGTNSRPDLWSATVAAAGAVAGSDIVVLPGQGHTAMDGAPDYFVDQISAFLR